MNDGHPISQPYSRAGLMAKLTGAAIVAVGSLLVGQGTSQLASTGTALTFDGGVLTVVGSAPAAHATGQVLIGGGAVRPNVVIGRGNDQSFIQSRNAANTTTIDILYLDATNRLILGSPSAPIYTAGTITSIGGVIIGTDPGGASLLRVGGSITLSAAQAIYSGGEATANLRCYFDAGNSYWRAPAGGHVWQNESGSNRMTLDTSGNLSTTAQVSCSGLRSGIVTQTYWSGSAFVNDTVSTYTTASSFIKAGNPQAGCYDSGFAMFGALGDGTMVLVGSFGQVGMSSYTAGNLATQISDLYITSRNTAGAQVQRMRFKSDGSVLIGVTGLSIGTGSTPARPLDVYGSARFQDASGIGTTIWSEAVTGCGGMGTNTNHPFTFLVNGSERGRINTSGAWILGTDPGGSERLRVGGAGRFDGGLCVRNASAIGAIAVLTDTETAPNAVSAWSATKHSILAGPAGGSSAIALACSVNQTNSEASILALTPGVAWNGLALRAGSVGVFIGGDTIAAIQTDGSSTADDTRFLLYDVTAGTLKRVVRGAADSAGTGYRTLRIAN